jgi:hypothetical protein
MQASNKFAFGQTRLIVLERLVVGGVFEHGDYGFRQSGRDAGILPRSLAARYGAGAFNALSRFASIFYDVWAADSSINQQAVFASRSRSPLSMAAVAPRTSQHGCPL